MTEPRRCAWVTGGSPAMVAYHDEEWGVPVHDDRRLFEFLVLEGAQAGLSWSTILSKRESYRKAFRDFDMLLPIAKRPNVMVKVSALPAYAPDDYPYRSMHPFVRKVYDAFGPKRQGRDEVIDILIKHTPIKDRNAYEQMRPAGLDPDGKLEIASIQQDYAYYQRAGHTTQPVDLAKVIDTSFQEYAVQRLGPYQR